MNYEEQIAQITAEIRELKSLLDKPTDELSGREKWLVANFDSELAKLEAKEKWLEGEITTERSFRLALATNSGPYGLPSVAPPTTSGEVAMDVDHIESSARIQIIPFNEMDMEFRSDLKRWTSVEFFPNSSQFVRVPIPWRMIDSKKIISMVDYPFKGIEKQGEKLLNWVNSLRQAMGIVVNVSGSGKTRMSYEMFKLTYGFYIDVSSSIDFQYLLEWLNIQAQTLSDCDKLEMLFQFGFNTFLAIRKRAMDYLIDNGGTPADWLDFQRSSTNLEWMAHQLKKLIASNIFVDISTFGVQVPIFVDEAYLLLQEMSNSFKSMKSNTERKPLYYAFCRYANRLNVVKNCKVVVAGTSFSLRHVEVTVSAGLNDNEKPSKVTVMHDTEFLTGEKIKEFLIEIFDGFDNETLVYLSFVLAGRARIFALFVKLFIEQDYLQNVSTKEQFNLAALDCLDSIVKGYCMTFYEDDHPFYSKSLLMFWYRFVPPHKSSLWTKKTAPESFRPFCSNHSVNVQESLFNFILQVMFSESVVKVSKNLDLLNVSPNVFYILEKADSCQVEYLSFISGLKFFSDTINDIKWFNVLEKILFGSNNIYPPTMKGNILELYVALKFVCASQKNEGEDFKCHPLLKHLNNLQIGNIFPYSHFLKGDKDGLLNFRRYLTHSSIKNLINFPSKLAGPDLLAWPFYCGLKSTWTFPFKISKSVAEKNSRSIRPLNLFLSNEERKGEQKDNSLGNMVNRLDFIPIRIELPFSETTNDIKCFTLENEDFQEFIGQEFVNLFKKFIESNSV